MEMAAGFRVDHMAITIRLANAEDQLRAQTLIIQTIRKVNARDYSTEQIRLWCGTNRRPWKMIQNGRPIKRLLAFDGQNWSESPKSRKK